ncbi:A/G-specific adenine glycosylase [Candidatus Woesearchaeota archaeon]|nr:A/G-specific adenine glycosylase [Candidatus Woesearchaeota archaeon]
MAQLFSQTILAWYSLHKRDLPWRSPYNTPYHVLVSEFMLQQTQVLRVMEKFREFTSKFPTLHHLADASKADVIKSWSGLGYNRRALLLHSFAQEVAEKHHGEIPNTKEELQQLPGMGPYTTGAILSFAFNLPEPAIDVNVRRIYVRYFQGKDQGLPLGKKEEMELYTLVKNSIPDGRSSTFHNALMDFGSLICTRDAPQCSSCPLSSSCQFYPLYDTKKATVLFVAEKKIEPGVYEQGKFIPNRIFRGRIVEFVRKNDGRIVSVIKLGKTVKADFNTEQEWLLKLCEKLQHEKLIKYELMKDKIRMYLGP